MKINEVNYKWSGTLSKRTKTEMIVLHHAAARACTPQEIHQWHLDNKWSGIGYHFVVRRNGQIFKGRPEDTIGAHATNYNSNSIGICFEGDYMVQTMTKEQLEAGKELVAYLKGKYGIDKVKAHRDLCNTDCPGSRFPFNEIANTKAISTAKENLVLEFQKAAILDGYKFEQYGADGIYGEETKKAMEQCVVKRRYFYKYKNCTKLAQKLLGVAQDGLCGAVTEQAIKEFQKKNGLVVDGCIGFNTWAKLLNIK